MKPKLVRPTCLCRHMLQLIDGWDWGLWHLCNSTIMDGGLCVFWGAELGYWHFALKCDAIKDTILLWCLKVKLINFLSIWNSLWEYTMHKFQSYLLSMWNIPWIFALLIDFVQDISTRGDLPHLVKERSSYNKLIKVEGQFIPTLHNIDLPLKLVGGQLSS